MSDAHVVAALGLHREVLEESWNSEDGPRDDEIRVMQRAMVLLGFPTGDNGRPWIDGVFGPYTRRALRQFQAESGLPTGGSFDAATRAAIYEAAAARLTAMDAIQRVNATGQLQRLQSMRRFDGVVAVRYYAEEAKRRVPPEQVAVFLALISWFNNGLVTAGLDLMDFLARTNGGEDGARARRLASRYGFLQFPGSYFEERGLDLDRAANIGDEDFHLDFVAKFIAGSEKLQKAAANLEEGPFETALAPNTVGCVLGGPTDLATTIATVQAVLTKKPVSGGE